MQDVARHLKSVSLIARLLVYVVQTTTTGVKVSLLVRIVCLIVFQEIIQSVVLITPLVPFVSTLKSYTSKPHLNLIVQYLLNYHKSV